MDPSASHAANLLRRYELFDQYADLVLRGLCTLPEAVDSYLWELGCPPADREAALSRLRPAPAGRAS